MSIKCAGEEGLVLMIYVCLVASNSSATSSSEPSSRPQKVRRSGRSAIVSVGHGELILPCPPTVLSNDSRHGGHDLSCRACNRGLFQMCENKAINGVTRNGGYGEYATLRTESAVRIPANMDPAEVAPLLCAGVTVFNGIRQLNILSGEIVAVQGLGGLGHLAIQYARKMGYRTVALSRGSAKKDFAMKLGATDYIDTEAGDVAAELQKLGGAACIVVTAPNPDVITPLIGGLDNKGKLLLFTAIGPVPVNTVDMVLKGLSVHGWPSGHALDSEEAIAFAEKQGVKCMIEKFPLAKANEAMEHMMSGKVRFRAVLTMD